MHLLPVMVQLLRGVGLVAEVAVAEADIGRGLALRGRCKVRGRTPAGRIPAGVRRETADRRRGMGQRPTRRL